MFDLNDSWLFQKEEYSFCSFAGEVADFVTDQLIV